MSANLFWCLSAISFASTPRNEEHVFLEFLLWTTLCFLSLSIRLALLIESLLQNCKTFDAPKLNFSHPKCVHSMTIKIAYHILLYGWSQRSKCRFFIIIVRIVNYWCHKKTCLNRSLLICHYRCHWSNYFSINIEKLIINQSRPLFRI